MIEASSTNCHLSSSRNCHFTAPTNCHLQLTESWTNSWRIARRHEASSSFIQSNRGGGPFVLVGRCRTIPVAEGFGSAARNSGIGQQASCTIERWISHLPALHPHLIRIAGLRFRSAWRNNLWRNSIIRVSPDSSPGEPLAFDPSQSQQSQQSQQSVACISFADSISSIALLWSAGFHGGTMWGVVRSLVEGIVLIVMGDVTCRRRCFSDDKEQFFCD